MKDKTILKKYVCLMPFMKLDVFDNEVYPCFIDFIGTSIISTSEIENMYDSKLLYDVRKSVLDGEYEFCDHKKCFHIINLLSGNLYDRFILKENVDENELIKSKFTEVSLNLDDSCNLFCGSCRKSLITSSSHKQKQIKIKLNKILDVICNDVEILAFSGVGELFSSKIYLDFLENFDKSKFPKLKQMTLFTNATLLNNKMWNRIEKSHEFIKELSISVDAGTKETYEKVRRGGKWDELINNINFISTIPNIKKIRYSFIIQDTNYKEMEMFIKLIDNTPHINNKSVDFIKIVNWGTYSDNEYKQKTIWDKNHPDYDDFIIEMNKVLNYKDSKNFNIFY